MKIKVFLIIFMLLVSALIIPIGTSYASYGDSNTFTTSRAPPLMSNQTDTSLTEVNQTQSNIAMSLSSTTNDQTSTNHTSQTIGMNFTSMVNDTQTPQQISDFVHQAVAHFKQQKDETRQVIFACRDQLQNATSAEIDKTRAGCITQLSAIKAKYQDERSHLQKLINQYRESVMVFLNDARGLAVDKASMDKAFADLISTMHMTTMSSGGMTGNVTGLMSTKNNKTNCINPIGGPTICQANSLFNYKFHKIFY